MRKNTSFAFQEIIFSVITSLVSKTMRHDKQRTAQWSRLARVHFRVCAHHPLLMVNLIKFSRKNERKIPFSARVPLDFVVYIRPLQSTSRLPCLWRVLSMRRCPCPWWPLELVSAKELLGSLGFPLKLNFCEIIIKKCSFARPGEALPSVLVPTRASGTRQRVGW